MYSLRTNVACTVVLLVVEVFVLLITDMAWVRWVAVAGIVLAVGGFVVNERRRRRQERARTT